MENVASESLRNRGPLGIRTSLWLILTGLALAVILLASLSRRRTLVPEAGIRLHTGGVQIVLPDGWEKLNQPTNFFVQQRARNVERNIAISVGTCRIDLTLEQYVAIGAAGFESGPKPQFEKISKLVGMPVSQIENELRSQIGRQMIQGIKQAYRSMLFELLKIERIDIAGAPAYEIQSKVTVLQSGGIIFYRQFALSGALPKEIINITFAGPEDIFEDDSLVQAIQK